MESHEFAVKNKTLKDNLFPLNNDFYWARYFKTNINNGVCNLNIAVLQHLLSLV